MFAKSHPQRLGWLKGDGSIHPVFYPAWAVVAIALIAADVKTRR